MKLTPLQEKILRLGKSLPSQEKEIGRWIIDNARPYIAVRQNNLW